MASCCEDGNEPSVSIKDGKFIDFLIILLASQEGTFSRRSMAFPQKSYIVLILFCRNLYRTHIYCDNTSVKNHILSLLTVK
jgi:hypothetical protein